MEFIFLGTSAGTPTRSRNVSAAVIKPQNSKTWFLVDCGEGTQQQVLNTDLSLHHLKAIFITHVHGDHCYGLPGLLSSASMQGRTKDLHLIAPEAIRLMIKVLQETTQFYLNFDLYFHSVEEFEIFDELKHFKVEKVILSHRVPSYAYVFTEKNLRRKLNLEKLQETVAADKEFYGELQKGNDVTLENGRVLKSEDYLLPPEIPKKACISGDNDTPELIFRSHPDLDILIHEATFSDELSASAKRTQHSTVKQVAETAEKNLLRNLILTHFSPRYQISPLAKPSIEDLNKEAGEHFSGTLFLAKDFDHFKLTGEGLSTN